MRQWLIRLLVWSLEKLVQREKLAQAKAMTSDEALKHDLAEVQRDLNSRRGAQRNGARRAIGRHT